MTDHEPVVVVGGGIGGLTLAGLLAERGLETVVLEGADSPSPATGGAFLNIAPNGMRALAAVGVAPQVTATGWHSTGIEFRNHTDRTVARIDTSDDMARYGVQNRMVRRADLHAALLDHATRHGVEIRYGHRVGSVTEEPGVVVLDYGDAEVVARAVIGADGVHSRVRAHVAPGVEPQYLGLVDVAGFSVCPPEIPIGQQTMWFGRRAFLGAYRTPNDEIWWFSNFGVPHRLDRRELRDTPASSWLERAEKAHHGDADPVTELLRTTTVPIGAWPITDLPSLPTWHSDRVCLIGDAAHATSPAAGQGASLALEDAVELATMILADGPSPRAFATFQAKRIDRVERLIRSARRNSNQKAPGTLGRIVRDLTLPLWIKLGARDVARAHDWTPPTVSPLSNDGGHLR